jgi:hypothetical protein
MEWQRIRKRADNYVAAVNRFDNVLALRGATKGDRVFSLPGRVPKLYIAALGTLKWARAVFENSAVKCQLPRCVRRIGSHAPRLGLNRLGAISRS